MLGNQTGPHPNTGSNEAQTRGRRERRWITWPWSSYLIQRGGKRWREKVETAPWCNLREENASVLTKMDASDLWAGWWMCHRRRRPLFIPSRCNAQILCSTNRFVLTCFLSGIREAKFNFKRHLDIYKLPDQSSNDLILSRQRTLTAGGGGEGVGPALTLHTAALHQLTVTAFGLCHSKLWQPWRQLQWQESHQTYLLIHPLVVRYMGWVDLEQICHIGVQVWYHCK